MQSYTSGSRQHTLLSFISLLLFIGVAFPTYAQQVIPIYNPSFEGEPGIEKVPWPWYVQTPSPDTEPDEFNVLKFPASNGATYAGIGYDLKYGFPSETFGYPLSQYLYAGKTYCISFDLAKEHGHLGIGSDLSTFMILGANNKDERGDTLWMSGLIEHTDWRRYTAFLQPKKDYNYLNFTLYNPNKNDTTPLIAVFIDNFSDITESFIVDVKTENACPGQPSGSIAITIPDADDSYTYSLEPGDYSGSHITGLYADQYLLTVKSSRGLTSTQTVTVLNSDLTFKASVNNFNCYGDKDFYIAVTATGGQPPYKYFLNNDITGQDTSTFRNLPPKTCSITVMDRTGCRYTDYVNIKEPLPLILQHISSHPTSCSDAMNGALFLHANGGTPPYTYTLPSYGRSQQDTVFSRLDAGRYHYVITDKNQCSIAGDAVIAQRWATCAVTVPSAFSPNDDGQNDLFKPRVQDEVTEYHLAVYGRWGQLVFESYQPGQGWDGTINGHYAPVGSYVWVLTYKDSYHENIQQRGSLTLLR